MVFNLGGLNLNKDVIDDNKDLVSMGAMSPNELRQLCGFDRVDDEAMDAYYISTSFASLEQVYEGQQAGGEDNAEKPDGGIDNQAVGEDDIDNGLSRKANAIVEDFKKSMGMPPTPEPPPKPRKPVPRMGSARILIARRPKDQPTAQWNEYTRAHGSTRRIGKRSSQPTRQRG
jgi:hypothetical protein